MARHAHLRLDYAREGGRSVARFAHDGPLRILQSMWPEGDAVCHNVLVHPPGGLVGGDTLQVEVNLAEGSHGLSPRLARRASTAATVNWPGRTCASAWNREPGWSGCRWKRCITALAGPRTGRMTLAPGASLLGWDIAALGLPQAHQPFARGSAATPGAGGRLAGARPHRGGGRAPDGRPAGPGGPSLPGQPLLRRGQRALADAARAVAGGRARGDRAPCARRQRRCHCAGPRVVVVRVLAPVVEPALLLLRAVRRAGGPCSGNCRRPSHAAGRCRPPRLQACPTVGRVQGRGDAAPSPAAR